MDLALKLGWQNPASQTPRARQHQCLQGCSPPLVVCHTGGVPFCLGSPGAHPSPLHQGDTEVPLWPFLLPCGKPVP